MDFQTLNRRQLQALCKKNKIPANLTNVAMADSLTALEFVEGIEEVMNPSEFDLAAQSPMVPPTGGRSRAVKVVETPGVVGATATRRRAAAASTSVRRKINESLDETEEVKRDVSVNTPAAAPASRRRVVKETSTVKPVYSTRRSTRLAQKVEQTKEISEAIKISSFTEETNENVEVSVDQSDASEMSVDNFKECSEESEVNSIVESVAIPEETSENQNGDVAVATLEQTIATDIKTETDQVEDEPVNGLMKVSEEVCGIETEDSIEDTKMYSVMVAQETKASIEDTEMNSTVAGEVKASFEVTDIISDVNEEALSEKDTGMNSNVNEEPKAAPGDSEMITCVDEEPKAAFEDSEMKPNVDEATDMDSKEEAEIVISEFEGQMVANVTVDIQEADKEEPSENETSDDVEDMSGDELVDDKDNLESNISAVGGVVSQSPMKNSAVKTPKTVGRFIQIPDDKENVDNGRNSVIVKDTKKKQVEDYSMRQLIKKIKELEISTQQKKEAGKDGEDIVKATARPALKALSENMMVVESRD